MEKLDGRVYRREGVRRFSASEECQVLIEEVAPAKIPIAVRFQHGSGSLVHMVEFVGKEVDDLRSVSKAAQIVQDIDSQCKRPDTGLCWRNTKSCHQHDSFYLGLALQPFYEAFFNILINELE